MNSKTNSFLNNIQIVFILIGLIWLIEVINMASAHSLYIYGVLPRSINGLPGIPLHPFIHGNLQHIVVNTIPLFVLAIFVALEGRSAFIKVTLTIIFFGGALLWIFGRASYHIGSSVLIFGYFGFILANVFYKRTMSSIFISIITLLLYGGLIYGIFPMNSYVSWEGHLFGMIAGAYAAKFIKNKS